ncbi:MAG: hypothetical protein ACM3UZ_11525 [Acidobacteriota bacterium]
MSHHGAAHKETPEELKKDFWSSWFIIFVVMMAFIAFLFYLNPSRMA